jgi:hypothetical protein
MGILQRALFILVVLRHRGLRKALFVLPFTQRRSGYGRHQRQTERNIYDGRREDQQSDRKKRNNRYQFRVLKDVRKDKKEQSRGNNCETAIKYIDETETVPEDESRGTKHKQNTPEQSDDPWAPRDFSGGRFV